MRDIEIHYNPYKMKTTMRIEGLMYARAVIIAVSKSLLSITFLCRRGLSRFHI
jgi:hypothetical protein